MSRTVYRLQLNKKASELGLEFDSKVEDRELLLAIRKNDPDFLVKEEEERKKNPRLYSQRLVRVKLICNNPSRRLRGSDQIFINIDGRTYGQTMFYTEMENSWHFTEEFLDALLGMKYAKYEESKLRTSNSTSPDTNGMPKYKGMAYEFSASLLPPLSEERLNKIKANQLAQEGLSEAPDEMDY